MKILDLLSSIFYPRSSFLDPHQQTRQLRVFSARKNLNLMNIGVAIN